MGRGRGTASMVKTLPPPRPLLTKEGGNCKGFTLIEMLLVVIILSTLAAMIVPRFAGRSEEAKIAAARSDIHANMGSALDLYELDNGVFPASLNALLTDPGNAKKWRGPYIKKKNNLTDPWGRPYLYVSPGTKNPDYDLSSAGPDGQNGTADDITNWDDDKK